MGLTEHRRAGFVTPPQVASVRTLPPTIARITRGFTETLSKNEVPLAYRPGTRPDEFWADRYRSLPFVAQVNWMGSGYETTFIDRQFSQENMPVMERYDCDRSEQLQWNQQASALLHITLSYMQRESMTRRGTMLVSAQIAFAVIRDHALAIENIFGGQPISEEDKGYPCWVLEQ